MAHQRPDTRIITGKATAKGKKARKSLCVEIGSLEHPYFSNSVRRQIREAGIESFSPKLPALYLEKKFERRETLRLNQTFNTDGGDSLDGGLHSRILTSSEIRKSMHHGHASKPTTSATSIQTPPLIHLEKKKDGDDLTNKGGASVMHPLWAVTSMNVFAPCKDLYLVAAYVRITYVPRHALPGATWKRR